MMLPGLTLHHGWISPDGCNDLTSLTAGALQSLHRRGILDDRSKVLRYGWSYESVKNSIPRRLDSWPDWLEQLRLRLPYPPSLEGCAITLNEYAPGYRISPHVDSLCINEPIQSISLGAEAELRFTRPDHSGLSDSHILILHPGTLCVLTGEARYQWFHEILPVKALRYSIVFRECPLTR